MSERRESLVRIAVLLVSGVILMLWKNLIVALALFHWVYTLITDKRIKSLADFCQIWNVQVYDFLKYITFTSNKRPFPFEPLAKNTDKFQK